MRFVTVTALCLLATAARADQSTPTVNDLGGYVEAEVAGQTIIFPTLKTEIDADVQGDLATVTVVQTFANPVSRPLHATYLFPLNQHAAVYEMILRVGEETVYAEIQRIEEARETFEQAKSAGKSAALLTQHRPNMFTQDIANLMPGLPIEVTLRYVQTVTKEDGDYRLVIPLVVGPRFQPAAADGVSDSPAAPVAGGVPRWQPQHQDPGVDRISGGATLSDSAVSFNRWELEQLPDYPPVAELQVPEQIDTGRVGVTVTLNAGMPIGDAFSDSHPLTEQADPERRRLRLTLADGRVLDNRDFVLRYRLAGADHQAGVLSYADHRGGFFSLLIEPPAEPEAGQITPREMVFVLDVSGSMHGLPLEASKAFMRQALGKLRPSDSFRIIRFSDAATEFSARPLPASADNVRRGITYTDSLVGGGGTVMTSGILQALQVPPPPGSLRLVSFLTDGYIGNDAEVLALINRHIGSARLFAFGVGTGVNRHLLTEMGLIGRGFSRFMDPTEDLAAVVDDLTERLQTPVLTDVSVDWGGLAPSELTPSRLPDLFAGQSLRLQGRYELPGDYVITVNGRVNGRRASLPLQVNFTAPQDDNDGEALALVWARSAIKDALRQIYAPPSRPRSADLGDSDDDRNDALKQRVIDLGLDFSLVTPWTAFVAVSERVYNQAPQTAETLPVPLPQVAGVSRHAYGKFSSGATPEPETWLGLLLLSALATGRLLARRRRPAQAQ